MELSFRITTEVDGQLQQNTRRQGFFVCTKAVQAEIYSVYKHIVHKGLYQSKMNVVFLAMISHPVNHLFKLIDSTFVDKRWTFLAQKSTKQN